jgi:tetrahydromethanopterin S-methyltransferase subunit B
MRFLHTVFWTGFVVGGGIVAGIAAALFAFFLINAAPRF